MAGAARGSRDPSLGGVVVGIWGFGFVVWGLGFCARNRDQVFWSKVLGVRVSV